MKIALIQMYAGPTPEQALQRAAEQLRLAKQQGADLAVLPEMFCCPYETPAFPRFAQPTGGQVWQALRQLAIDNEIYLAAGSVPEAAEGKVYNTAYAFAPDGTQLAAHRKMHLFDIDVQGGQRFFESETLTAGAAATTFPTPWGVFGLCVCYDIRFPELFRIMADKGAVATLIPAAFNMTTGPLHWELLHRARAVDNQMFLFGAAPARDPQSSYQSWAHSIAVSPWGRVLGQLEEQPGILMIEPDFAEVAAVRQQIPALAHRRSALYHIEHTL